MAAGYVYFFRGSPLLAQLFLLYYGLGSLKGFWQDVGLWWFFRDAWLCTLLAFTLNTAAYQAEIFRGSLMAVAPGQHEAARR
jgi:polar amino acid transport system permease protein